MIDLAGPDINHDNEQCSLPLDMEPKVGASIDDSAAQPLKWSRALLAPGPATISRP